MKKLSSQLRAIVMLGALGLIIVSVVSLFSLRSGMREDREAQISNLLKLSRSMVASFQAEEAAGKLTRAEAQSRAAAALMGLQSGDSYVAVRGEGDVLIVHVNKAKIGKPDPGNKLPDGRTTVQAYRDVLAKTDMGFVEILTNKPGRPVDEVSPKLNGVTRFEPWGWTLATGFFVDDIKATFWGQARALGILVIALLAFTLGAATFLSRRIYAQLGGEPSDAAVFTRHVAEGDLTYQPSGKRAPENSLIGDLSRMQNDLRSLVGQVQHTTEQVDQSVHTIFSELEDIRHATDGCSEATGSSAAAIEQMTVSISLIAGSAQESEQHSGHTTGLSSQGEALTRGTAQGISEVAAQLEQTTGIIAGLAQRSQQIGSIAQTIQEIAEQTNMLALNAAIEAARAGEQGRGFAVVADEVRKLAERTARATAEISQTIQAIQNDTEHAVQSMQAVKPQVARGVEQANHASEALRDIRSSTEETLEKIRDVAHATSEQSAASTAIANNVERIAGMLAETQSSVEKTAHTAGELRERSGELRGLMAKFSV